MPDSHVTVQQLIDALRKVPKHALVYVRSDYHDDPRAMPLKFVSHMPELRTDATKPAHGGVVLSYTEFNEDLSV